MSTNNGGNRRGPEEIPYNPDILNELPRGYTPGMYQAAPQPWYRAAQQGNNYYQDLSGNYNQMPEQTPYNQAPQRMQPGRAPVRANNRPSHDNSRRDDRDYKQNKRDNKHDKKSDKKAHKADKNRNNGQQRAERAPFILRAIGWVLFIIQLILSLTTGFLMVWSKMLPLKYELLGIGALLLMLIIVFILLRHGAPRKKFGVGMFFTILLSVFYVFIIYYVYGGIDTLMKITGIRYETVNAGVYVRMDDPAQDIEDVKNYTFGILGEIDRENTDYFVDEISDDVGKNIDTAEYSDMMTQMDALLNGEVGAIIINQSNLSVIREMEGYENIDDRIREIKNYERSRLVFTAPDEDAEIDAGEPFAVFISGIDTYGSISNTSRSDVNIIGIINPKTHQILLVSTPRDYYVPLSVSNGRKDKLTHAGIYGVDCSVQTLEMLYDTDIQYYFRVNFSGFQEIVDALDGITVNSDMAFSAFEGQYHFDQGPNYLNGDQALAFARERHAFAEGDRQRGRNQMLVISAVVDKMTSPALLANYSDVMGGLEGSFQTSIPYDLISDLVSDQLDDGTSWDVQQFSVDGSNSSGTTYSMPSQTLYVMEPNMDTVNQAKNYINQVLAGESIEDRITVPQ